MKISKILIVDNDLKLLNLLKDAFGKEGLSISTARDGKMALEELIMDPPDILITGLIIPKISGEQLIEYVRSDSNLNDIYIVVLSGALREYSEPENLKVDYCLNKKDLETTRNEVLELVRQIGENKKRPPRPEIPRVSFQPRKVVKELLADRNEREHVFKCLKEGLIIFATDHHVFEANPAACEILEKSINDILNKPLESHFDQEYQDRISHVIKGIKSGSKTEDILSISYGNKRLVLHFSGIAEPGSAEQLEGILLVQDITRQSLAEESLDQERNFYSGIIESIKEGIVVLRRDLTIKSVNHFFPTFFDKDRSKIIDQKCHTIFFNRNKPCPDCFLDQSEIFDQGKDFSVNWTLQDYKGDSYHFKVSGTPLEMQDEVITSVVLTYDDITRLERLNDYLNATATVASGISNNFRNILAGIMNSSQLLQLKYQDNPELQKYSSQIIRLAKTGSDLITDLLQFSRKGSGKPKTVTNLAEVLRETCRLISRSFDKKVDIRMDIPELLIIHGNRSALRQVFINMCTNARDAMPDGGELNIAAEKEKNRTVITIADTGCGMDERTTEMMFDPFFTTKESGEGKGLGLSIAYGIVKDHGGEIHVQSQKGQGSSFKISFPLPDSKYYYDKQSMPEIVRGSGEKVLIVDDDETFLESIEELLVTLGYSTNSVTSGQKGIEEYKTWRPDLVLLDRNMPKMDGLTTSKKVLAVDPKAKMIFISGYEEEGPNGIDDQIKKSIRGYLTKPFDVEELSRVISEVINK